MCACLLFISLLLLSLGQCHGALSRRALSTLLLLRHTSFEDIRMEVPAEEVWACPLSVLFLALFFLFVPAFSLLPLFHLLLCVLGRRACALSISLLCGWVFALRVSVCAFVCFVCGCLFVCTRVWALVCLCEHAYVHVCVRLCVCK